MGTLQRLPDPPEQYCRLFGETFARPIPRATFRMYLQGLSY